MKNYETLMLLRTEATGDEIKFLEDSVDKRVSGAGGEVVTFDKWGKLRLAYPVSKQEYGFYILSRYSLPEEAAVDFEKGLSSFFKIKCGDFLMRHVTVHLEGKMDPDYKRPEAVDASGGGRFGRGRGTHAASARPPGVRGAGFRSSAVDDEEKDDFEKSSIHDSEVFEKDDDGEEN